MSDDEGRDARRARRLARYDELRAERPARFVNPPGAAYEIVFDPEVQAEVADRSAARLRELGRPEEYGDMGVIYEDAFVIAVRDTVRFRSGQTGPYIRVLGQAPGAGAVILPVLSDGRILLTRNFRHALRGWQWEIPRGFAEPGDEGPMTAIRELQEEVGVTVDKVELLGQVAGEDEPVEIFLARLDADALPTALPQEAAEEGVDDFWLCTPPELAGLIAAGEITDHLLLCAYALATAKKLL